MTNTRKSLLQLEAHIAGLVELDAISIGTAKKALRGLSFKAGTKPLLVRPASDSPATAYMPPKVSAAVRAEIAQRRWPGAALKLGEDTVVIPRGTGTRGKALALALHEHGHAADPLTGRWLNAAVKTQREAKVAVALGDRALASRLDLKAMRAALRIEKRANQNVLAQITKHGKPEEVIAWKRFANQQMRTGYRTPLFKSVAAGMNAKTLAAKRGVLHRMPFLRKRFSELQSRLPICSFGRSISPGAFSTWTSSRSADC